MATIDKLKGWARVLKSRCKVLVLAVRHPRTPWYARACGVLTLLYALSPLDLIPDFIPVLGLLDDLVLVPLGLWVTIQLIPVDVWKECQIAAEGQGPPETDARGIVLIIAIWAITVVVLAGLVLRAR